MKQPSEIEKALRIETHAEDSSHQELTGPAYGEKQYRYELLFTGSSSLSFIEKKVGLVEEKEELPLKLGSVRPRLIQTDTALESGYLITVTEEQDRCELENHQLGTFTDET